MTHREGKMTTHLWTWEGTYFGCRDGNDLWTHDGRHVGRFRRDDVYGPDGRYMGEVTNGNRLITSKGKSSLRQASFAPYGSRVGHVSFVNYVGNVMLVGYEDFPAPDKL
jgi:hypothetical protein